MKWRGSLFAALALASCAFGAERPLFDAGDAVFPITDGALYDWRPHPEDEEFVVRFRRAGDHYVLDRIDESEETPMRVLFVSIIQTHDDDLIAQIHLEEGQRDAVAYAFLWPLGDDRYRVFFEPRGLNASDDAPAEAGRYCMAASYGGCTFKDADAVRDYYLNVLYPAFASGHIPARYLSISPVDANATPAPTPPRKPRPQ